MNVTQVYESILEKLEEDLDTATVLRSAADALQIEIANGGNFGPYVVVSFGGPIEAAKGRHITDRRQNMLKSWVVVTSVAPIDSDALMNKDKVIDSLWGFRPDDSDQMILTGGTAQSVSNEQSKPQKFIHTVMFEIHHNMG